MNNRNIDFIPKFNAQNVELKDYPPIIPQMTFSKEMLSAVIIREDKDNIIITLKREYYETHKIDKTQNYRYQLPYHIPKKPRNIDAYLNSPYHKKLADRYETFSTYYKQQIIDEVSHERQVILKEYPEIKQLVTKIRQKSLYSYEDKENQKIIDTNGNPDKIFIRDIIGARHIPYALNSSDAEDDLLPYTTYIRLALSRMHSKNSNNSDFELQIIKDYINEPEKAKSNIQCFKDNLETQKKYQSVHLIYYNKHNPDCCYEDQVRTPNMEFIAKKDTHVGHFNYKPVTISADSPLRVPKYTIIITDPQTRKR